LSGWSILNPNLLRLPVGLPPSALLHERNQIFTGCKSQIRRPISPELRRSQNHRTAIVRVSVQEQWTEIRTPHGETNLLTALRMQEHIEEHHLRPSARWFSDLNELLER
jgi:hypothetical protein